MNIFVIKIKDRFFYEYKNKRIKTAWSLVGAKLFTPFCDELEKLEKVFTEKKIKFEKVFIKIVEEEKQQPQRENITFNPIEIPKDGKEREQLIIRFTLPQIMSQSLIEVLLIEGYRATLNKFSISFNGSKGYLSNFEISCEGHQKADNRVFIDTLYNKDRKLKNIIVNVFYSDEFGVRLSTGSDEPKVLSEMKNQIDKKHENIDVELGF